MTENNVFALRQKDEIDDPLTEILRSGAKRLIEQAVEAEFAAFLGSHADLKLPDGRQRVVRHGRDPVRPIQTGIGPVEVKRPKARNRGALSAEERIRYSSSILPKWARRTKSLDALLPALYLRGISAGDFQEVLAALLGKDAPNLSPAVIARRFFYDALVFVPRAIPDLPRAYVLCTEDTIIPPKRQRAFAALLGVSPIEIASVHAAFAFKPKELADILATLAA